MDDIPIKSIDYFPEPPSPDESWQEWDETAVHWLTRSTQPRARAIREFVNVNLGYFSPKHAKRLTQKLSQDWQSFFFEIVVGRYLQVLGAELEYEPDGSNGTHVDYRATFPDGVVVSVECVSKRFNQEAQQTVERNGKLARMLAEVGPTGWIIEFKRFPEPNSADEFRPYVENAKQFYSTLPEPTVNGRHVEFGCQGISGQMELEAIPFPKGTMANHLGPTVTFMDDSIVRLKNALVDSHKRRQGRGAVQPVLLAIDCPFNGPDAEDFDQALFGQTVDHLDMESGMSLGITFNPNGLLVTDKDIPFAGVLAFLRPVFGWCR